MSQNEEARLDPYKQAALNENLTLQEKISDLHSVIQSAKTGMLVTRGDDGSMHSRAMNPATPYNETQLSLIFLANNVSAKFKEIKNDDHVNVSFYDQSSTNWASYSGKAKVTQDKDVIKKHWSTFITAYIGDLHDGVHRGNEDDPRVAAIEIIPDEIHYWITKHSNVVRSMQVAASAVSGKATSPGELRIITKDEVQLTQNLNTK
ncbi:hypothetical protein SERLA73DRAFT_180499 [Serpula lacrymans var. lacrymans S7.3]|uniref:General stress protein FMN-binding split barrel domain-containing protein n=2 Tax=Serpula lacrymans var. lacrymans TaxID=341189 RepID=F8PV03_SERL3|nr:uncharacterized protein SERLADRAFT_466129 [Serpula lacrymans var. lacrymans S7.9]EGO00083.1 hypothetical protein SERLA73DRAFT_180499 [Serpula lacrymans var. lacrymans S7.3]EGO25644.1 hypothetical protein SERLADRAFT_466129 [Serpula lacrymans var. lacrymans S7.9]